MENFYIKIENVIEMICKIIGGISVAAFVIITFMQVIGRNLLQLPMIWANDLSVICFVWATFFGSAIAVRYKRHYVLELIPEHMVVLNRALDVLADISGFLFFLFLVYFGYIYSEMGMSRMSTSLEIPQAYFFACIPASACFMTFFNIGIFIKDCKLLKQAIEGGDNNE